VSDGMDERLPVVLRGPNGELLRPPLDPGNPPAWLYADPPDLCRKCMDTGVVVEEFNTVGEYCDRFGLQPADLDRVERSALAKDTPYRVAAACDCMKHRELEQRFRTAVGAVPTSSLRAARFEGVQRHVPYKVQALDAARKFVDVVVTGAPAMLVFEGETGKGKTYIGLATLRAVIEAGGSAKYILSGELCDDIRQYAVDVGLLRKYRKSLTEKTAVFIDDFGFDRLGAVGGAVIDQYAELLRSYETGRGLIIATNRPGNIDTTGFELAMREVFGDRADAITRRLAEIQVAPAVRFGGQGSMLYAD